MGGDIIELILLKSEKCGHCVSFMPIFEKFTEKKICNYNVFDVSEEKKELGLFLMNYEY